MKNVKDRRRPLFWGIFLTLCLRGFSAFSFFFSIDILYIYYIYYLYIITKKRGAKRKRLREGAKRTGRPNVKKMGRKTGGLESFTFFMYFLSFCPVLFVQCQNLTSLLLYRI